ncbi:MAG: DUF371 domain-containing protein, partial [Salinirussus sp.]
MRTVEITARGHENVRATHASTLELTSENWLTPAGDCIIGIEADTTPADIPSSFVNRCRDDDARIRLELAVGDQDETLVGHGDPRLSFDSDTSLVCRTSQYVDERTVLVGADTAAEDLDRGIVNALRDGAD